MEPNQIRASPVKMSNSSCHRASPSQIRRAASRSSLTVFRDLLHGWTGEELDEQATTQDGKNAAHMAAWFGPLENLEYLLRSCGCNMDAISKGQYNYGKTPIFYAATRSRLDVVTYLLDCGAFVKIVNNKGQSVRSIAASHFGQEIVDKITDLERQQHEREWWNFRVSQSDGLEYGDLDPRFLDRELRDSDVVTEFAVNPTTAQSRRGSFFRRNPQLLGTSDDYHTRERNYQKQRKIPPVVSAEEFNNVERAWDDIRAALSIDRIEVFEQLLLNSSLSEDIITIIRLNDKLRQPWISEVAIRLRDCAREHVYVHKLIDVAKQLAASKREKGILEKLDLRVSNSANHGEVSRGLRCKPRKRSGKALQGTMQLLLERACRVLAPNLSMDVLTSRDKTQLSLPNVPEWVDDVDELERAKALIETHELVAIDTEWYTNSKGASEVATLQVAVVNNEVLHSFVIDLMVTSNQVYRTCTVDFVKWLFEGRFVLVGYAFCHNDVPKLEAHVGVSLLASIHVLDLQHIAADGAAELPGLQNTIGRYSTVPLSKDEQCSDWACRPLSTTQLEYAGLDAGVLLVLLAELRRIGAC